MFTNFTNFTNTNFTRFTLSHMLPPSVFQCPSQGGTGDGFSFSIFPCPSEPPTTRLVPLCISSLYFSLSFSLYILLVLSPIRNLRLSASVHFPSKLIHTYVHPLSIFLCLSFFLFLSLFSYIPVCLRNTVSPRQTHRHTHMITQDTTEREDT